MKIDHLRENEVLPSEGIVLPVAEGDWVWVARDDDDLIIGYLVCVRGHGIVMPIRLHRLSDDVPALWLSMLIRAAARESRARGYVMYITWLGDDTESQRGLRELCNSQDAKFVPMNGDIVAGLLNSFAGERCLRQL